MGQHLLGFENVLIGYGHRATVRFPNRLQHQEVAQSVGNGEPKGDGVGILPNLGFFSVFLPGLHNWGASGRLYGHKSRKFFSDPSHGPEFL